jgi:hypothetical protein
MEKSKATHEVVFFLEDEWVKRARIENSATMSEGDLAFEVSIIIGMADFFEWDRYEVLLIERMEQNEGKPA